MPTLSENYREWYLFEHNRKETLVSHLTTPLGLLTLSISAAAYFYASVDWSGLNSRAGFIFCAMAGLALLFTVFAGWEIYRGFCYSYGYIPSPAAVKKFHEGYTAHFLGDRARASAMVDELLDESYEHAATANRQTNVLRSEHLNKATVRGIISLILWGLTAAPFVFVRASSAEDQKISRLEARTVELELQLRDAREQLKSNGERTEGLRKQLATLRAAARSSPPPPPPARPPVEFFKEGALKATPTNPPEKREG